MILTRRWRSYRAGFTTSREPGLLTTRTVWLSALIGVSLLLLLSITVDFIVLRISVLSLALAAHLLLLFSLWGLLWFGPLWGMGALSWAATLVLLTGLAHRQPALSLLPVGFFALGWLVQEGLNRWQAALREAALRGDRLEEGINTLAEEVHHVEEQNGGLSDRLQRYQQLRQVTNAFSSTLSMDDLDRGIVESTGQLVVKAELVMLYLVDRHTLNLELKSVWRRFGSATIKAKRGDVFDQWVMRHGQPLLVQEPVTDFRFQQVSRDEIGRPIGSLVAVPMFSQERLLGVLRVESSRAQELGPEELRFVRILGDLAALAIENCRLYERMASLARTDDLTGLAARGYLEERFREELSRSRDLHLPLALLLIDIDHFKTYNDTFGHSAGDKLLKNLAQMLLNGREAGSVIGRFGGEEFVCLFPGLKKEEALQHAERIRAQVERTPVELRRTLTRTTVSIGIAVFPEDGETTEALLKAADTRLYQAKNLGRNTVCAA